MATPSNFDPQPTPISARPPPNPPKFLKRQIYQEPRVFKAIDDHAVNEARTNYRNFRDLIWNLIFKKNYNDLEKARVIFRWMTTKNMYTIMFDSELPGSPEAVLGGFKDGKTTYARIFECLASFAGLHCITLSGWAKGVDYRPGMPITNGPINHSWNAVHVDGNWQLVDSHWATRYLQSERNTPENLVYEYDDFYFLPEPNQLVYSHCPEDPAWQLCYPARSRAEYEDYPLVKSYFFTVGMQFLQQNQGVMYTHKGILVLSLGATKPAAFTFKLVYGDNGYENIQGVPLKRYVIQETTDRRVSFYLRAPREGNYYLTVFAQQVQERMRLENIYKATCEYKVICDQAAAEVKPFPMCSDSNWGPGAPVQQYGLTPNKDTAILHAPNGRAEVVFTKTRPCRLYARLTKDGLADQQLENAVSVREQDDKVYVTCNLPRPGEYGLEVYGNEPAREGDTFTHICQYLATYTDRNPRALYGQVYDRDDLAHGHTTEPIPYNYAPDQYAAGPGELHRAGPPGGKQGQDPYSPDRYGDDPAMRSEYYGGPGGGSLGRGPAGSKVPPGTAAKPGQRGVGPYEENQQYQSRDGAPGAQDDRDRRYGPGGAPVEERGLYGAPGAGPGDTKGGRYGPGGAPGDDRGRYGPGGAPGDDRGRYGPAPGGGPGGQDDRGRYAGPGSDGRDNYPAGGGYSAKEDPWSTLERRAQPLPSHMDQLDKQNQHNLGAAYGGAYPFGTAGERAGMGPDSYRQRPTEPELEYKPHDPKMYTSTIKIQPPTSFEPVPVLKQEQAPEPAPPAVPPKPFKDTSIFTNVDLHAVEVSKEEHKSFRELVWHLIYARNITNELEKARAIFLWLCSKDLAQISFDNAPKGSPEEILMNLQKGQTTYAVVYETLCSYAGLHCKTISGYAKGAEYKPGMKFTGEQGQHSWNAVLVEGAWRLVDCHWAARRLVGKKVTPENVRYELDEYYFMPDPHQLIFTHYPDDQSWQLLDRPISLADFENLVPVKSAFFKYGLQILSHREAVIVTSKEVTIRVGCPPFKAEQLAFTFTLAYDDGKEEFRGTKLNRFGMQEMLDNVSYFTIRPPEKGAYRLILYAKDLTTQTKEGVYGGICEYEVKMETNPAKPIPFPPCVHTSWGPGDSVHKYDLQALQKGAIFSTVNGQAEVKFKLPKELRFTAKLKNKDLEEKDLQGYIMHRVVGELAVFTFTAPAAGEYGLEIYANDPEKDGNSLYHAFQYLIIAQEVKGPVEALPTLPPGYLGPQPTFKKLGLSTTSHSDPFVQTDSGDLQIAFGMGQPLRMTSQLIYVSQNQNEDYSDYILQQSQLNNNVAFMLKLPKVGMYKFQVYALPFSDTSESLPGVYNYLINCRMTHATLVAFPKQYGQWKEGCLLSEPLEGHLQPNRASKGSASSFQAVYYKVTVPKASSVAVVVGEDWTQLDQKGNAWEGEVLMEKHWGKESKAALCANYGGAKASYSTLLEYTL